MMGRRKADKRNFGFFQRVKVPLVLLPASRTNG
jgi:hypothetical protein